MYEPPSLPGAPNLLAHDSLKRCGVFLDFVEQETAQRAGEDWDQYFARREILGSYFWSEVVYWWSVMDLIEHENMEMFFDSFYQDWELKFKSDVDRTMWNQLPRRQPITLYRGQDEDVAVGLAWTTNRRQAEWFAESGMRGCGNKKPVILTTQLWKRDVAFCCAHRGEREVVPFNIPTQYTVEPLISRTKRAA